MGQKEKKEIYTTCKKLGLPVKWTMSEAALRETLDKHNADQEKKASAEQKKKEKELELEAVRKAEEEAMAKAVEETRAKAEAEAIEEAEEEDEELDDEDVEIVFENGDEEEEPDYETAVVFDTPKAKPKPPAKKRVLQSLYFPGKKKSKSEDPYEIYKNQMNKAKAKKQKKK